MKVTDIPTPKACGLTLVEVLVVLAVVIIFVVLLRPSSPRERRSASIDCVANLKKIGVGLTIYADDNNGKFPFQISITNGGTMELIYSNHVFPHYQKVSHALAEPKILVRSEGNT